MRRRGAPGGVVAVEEVNGQKSLWTIYSLIDPCVDNSCYSGYSGYIGYTRRPLDVRLREHVLAAQRGYEARSYSRTRSPKLIWLGQMLDAGLERGIVPLLYVPADARHWPYIAGLQKRCIAAYTATQRWCGRRGQEQ
jgi:hypothetical protein